MSLRGHHQRYSSLRHPPPRQLRLLPIPRTRIPNHRLPPTPRFNPPTTSTSQPPSTSAAPTTSSRQQAATAADVPPPPTTTVLISNLSSAQSTSTTSPTVTTPSYQSPWGDTLVLPRPKHFLRFLFQNQNTLPTDWGILGHLIVQLKAWEPSIVGLVELNINTKNY